MVTQTRHPEQFTRYAPFFQFLFDLDVPVEVVASRSKKIAHLDAPQSRLRSLLQVEAALDWAGQNLGAVTHQNEMPGVNRFGVANLDIDYEGHGFNLSPFKLMIRRTGETSRAQYLFRVSDAETQLNGTHHGTHDVCTWLFILPGSIHKSGSLYELWIKEGEDWVLWDGQTLSLDLLPILDPDQYRITLNESELMKLGIDLVKQPKKPVVLKRKRSTRAAPIIWVAATGEFKTRIKKARYYLKHWAWRSQSGMRGHSALIVAAANLRLYFCLPKGIAIKMLKKYFNPRCVDSHGNPSPWSDKELEHKWDQAGVKGMYPTLGETDIRAVQKVRANSLQAEVQKFLAEYTVEDGTCNPTLLREAFLVWRCGEAVSETAFGRAVSTVTGIRSSSPAGVRVYKGFSLSSQGLRLITHGLESQAEVA